MSTNIALGVAAAVLLLIGVLALDRCNDARNTEHDDEVRRRNDDLMYFPPDLECAPSFKNFAAPLQRAVDASPITDALASVYGDTVEIDSRHCNEEILPLVAKHPKVRRLLERCKITKLKCSKYGHMIELRW